MDDVRRSALPLPQLELFRTPTRSGSLFPAAIPSVGICAAMADSAAAAFVRPYSLRSIATASTRVARRTGMYEASAEAAISSAAVPRMVEGSRG
jgi:hypothetical protein